MLCAVPHLDAFARLPVAAGLARLALHQAQLHPSGSYVTCPCLSIHDEPQASDGDVPCVGQVCSLISLQYSGSVEIGLCLLVRMHGRCARSMRSGCCLPLLLHS